MNEDTFDKNMPGQKSAKLASEQSLPSGNKTEKTSANTSLPLKTHTHKKFFGHHTTQ